MKKIVLFDTQQDWNTFLPLTFTRSIADLLLGMRTIRQKWEDAGFEVCSLTQAYLQMDECPSDETLYIKSTCCPSPALVEAVHNMAYGESIQHEGVVLAFFGKKSEMDNDTYLTFRKTDIHDENLICLKNRSDLFSQLDKAIRQDYAAIVPQKEKGELASSNTLIGDALYISPTAKAQAATFNTSTGPIYIDEGAEVMEGAVLRGPIYIGKNAVVKLSAKIYGATTIGTYCKVGGEISNSMLLGYSNKGHDGFLGNSVLGEWCNLGADTNTSNLKNNYGKIKTYDYGSQSLQDTGLIFHGLIMGDHSKCGINTMFNTGTIVGVSANIFGGGFPAKHIPSFSWGGADGMSEYRFDKAIETARAMMGRRGKEVTEHDLSVLQHIFETTKSSRT